MFDALTSKLESTFRRLRDAGKLNEKDIDAALEEVRTALLEADVNYKVTKDFCAAVKKKALGKEVQRSLSPGQTVIKFVHEELCELMGKVVELNTRFAPPVIIMLIGLQGSGKTTSCGKLARYLRDELKRRPLLVPCDVYRPAAIDQLKILGSNLNIETFDTKPEDDPVDVAKRAVSYAKTANLDVIILDTAGRLQIDSELMDELVEVVEAVEPHEILLVADAMTGQEAVNIAKGFNDQLEIDGLILTKLDGDARGGAALSMRAITGKPIKFIGVGEKLDALEVFHPDRMASRILGMGDVMTLIEKAAKHVDLVEAKELEKKLRKNKLTFEDFYSQLQMIKKMGSLSSLIKMVPGGGAIANQLDDEKASDELARIEAIILSMTPQERKEPWIFNGSRRKRVALGSGRSVEEVNRLLKEFEQMQKMMKKLSKLGPNALRGMGGLMGNKMSGGFR